MGCDIHIYAEVKRVNGKWEKVGVVFETGFDPELIRKHPDMFSTHSDSPYCERNYSLFSILADVRNGYGCAGCDTGDGFNVIAMPKDLPDDISKEVKEEADKWDGDGHSHSFLTVSELLAFDWNQKGNQRGWVNVDEYRYFKKNGTPNGWCGGIDGGNVIKVSNEFMDQIILDETFQTNKLYYTKIQWDIVYSDYVSLFLNTTLPSLKALDGDPDKVRIVFWFDN